jgi:hypothetical protein
MSLGAKVAMSAVIGGTAEKLGGGKFANGAVTGAYVMMFNHLGHHSGGEKKSFRVTAEFKKLALALRYNPYGNNPFFMAEAIFFDGGVGFVGSEFDGGFFLVLAGEDAGALIPYTELAGGAALEASVGIEIGRVDLADKSIAFQTEMLFGERSKAWGGTAIAGGAVSHSTYRGVNLIPPAGADLQSVPATSQPQF